MSILNKLPACCARNSVIFLLFIAYPLFMPVAQAATYTYNNSTTGAIPAESPTCSSVLTRTFNVTDNVTVGDVNLGIAIQHQKRNDLEIYLRSPAGTEMVLMSAATSPSRNVNYSYDDEASISYETGSSSGDHSTSVATYQFNARPPTALGGAVKMHWEHGLSRCVTTFVALYIIILQ